MKTFKKRNLFHEIIDIFHLVVLSVRHSENSNCSIYTKKEKNEFTQKNEIKIKVVEKL